MAASYKLNSKAITWHELSSKLKKGLSENYFVLVIPETGSGFKVRLLKKVSSLTENPVVSFSLLEKGDSGKAVSIEEIINVYKGKSEMENHLA